MDRWNSDQTLRLKHEISLETVHLRDRHRHRSLQNEKIQQPLQSISDDEEHIITTVGQALNNGTDHEKNQSLQRLEDLIDKLVDDQDRYQRVTAYMYNQGVFLQICGCLLQDNDRDVTISYLIAMSLYSTLPETITEELFKGPLVPRLVSFLNKDDLEIVRLVSVILSNFSSESQPRRDFLNSFQPLPSLFSFLQAFPDSKNSLDFVYPFFFFATLCTDQRRPLKSRNDDCTWNDPELFIEDKVQNQISTFLPQSERIDLGPPLIEDVGKEQIWEDPYPPYLNSEDYKWVDLYGELVAEVENELEELYDSSQQFQDATSEILLMKALQRRNMSLSSEIHEHILVVLRTRLFSYHSIPTTPAFLVDLTKTNHNIALIPSLTLIGNVVKHSADFTASLCAAGLVESLTRIIKYKSYLGVRFEAMWVLSHLAKFVEGCQSVFSTVSLPSYAAFLVSEPPRLQIQTAHFFLSIAETTQLLSTQHQETFLDSSVITYSLRLLQKTSRTSLILLTLQLFHSVLLVGESLAKHTNMKSHIDSPNVAVERALNRNAAGILTSLIHQHNQEVNQLAESIVTQFFAPFLQEDPMLTD
ncbi:hypothetical protein BLNAU_6384 [Blattamonas nauphoetae]|uniref:Uncharacterized protein n=1 Tax=Blattamonas nauphoetae TaxID=2049346 RepID=A0ABQ9Y4D5_9EUKA|nr:hypothetical protein BLNAU_6384 [Blattamonas nauphoetae]